MGKHDLTRAAEYLAQGAVRANDPLVRIPLSPKIDCSFFSPFAAPDLPIIDVTGQALAEWALAVIDGLCDLADEQSRQIKNMEMRMMSREKLGRIDAALADFRRAMDSRP